MEESLWASVSHLFHLPHRIISIELVPALLESSISSYLHKAKDKQTKTQRTQMQLETHGRKEKSTPNTHHTAHTSPLHVVWFTSDGLPFHLDFKISQFKARNKQQQQKMMDNKINQ